MARKIGIFQRERDVVNAINQLEQFGLKPGEMMVLAKDYLHTRALRAECDVHADGIMELEAALDGEDHNEGDYHTTMSAGLPGTAFSPIYGFNAMGGSSSAGLPFFSPFIAGGGGDSHERTFMRLGLDEKEAELCAGEVMGGAWAVIVETSESKSLLDKDGGPDLSSLGIAEGVFRSCGASRIVNGS
ncbi:hypothetical protein A7K91_18430 [Paenibacillus oryzae]|uniref:General stress protein 17M-like domain-containing protein n=1 Tax=Paenibacillus oryzae TaxID=1844972 RepID=A0A1A5YQM2_9BACL|nr:general stress protein [Paenibacillus oryzae]OBR67916.1 hypothetical protein A7K91_18430 [Paenibacillus oryzae]